ncbi:MAG: histidine triad nucleotide-binding protein [Chloroflexi bacterium]|nr:histidine triad nucleotide-binding protein [Chloroflexota bacterium]
MNKDCIFCRIISGEIQSDIIYQDEEVIAIRDINPQAPTHLLVLPRAHIPSLADVGADQEQLLGHLVHVANELAKSEGIAEKGYRLVINCGLEAGQEVPHLHLHLLGGRPLGKLG